MTGWFAWGSSVNNYYYDWGGDVYYNDDTGYWNYGDQQAATGAEFAQQAMTIADTGAQTLDQAVQNNTEMQWMSLGVFALTHEEEGDPTMYLQLAVAKDGTLAGTYWNSATDQTQEVQGSVEKRTQRAAWTIGDNKDTVMETGIYNLTQDETAVIVHFGKEKSQQWLMVRLDEPEEEGSGDTGS